MLKEDRETLSQRATQEILQVISHSRHDEGPVFDAILKNAQSLCSAPLAFLSLVNEPRTHVLIPAQRGSRPEFARVLEGFAEPVERSELLAVRPVVDPQVIMMDDIADDDLYRKRDPRRVQMVEVEGVRSVLVVPLIKDDQGIGCITLYRREVSPFSEGDVSLVQNFAAQAVIAIENVRQFRELERRLEREAATREILQIISESREDEQPVFEAILERACKLCEAPSAGLLLGTSQDELVTFAASAGANKKVTDALRAANLPMDANASYSARAILEEKLYHLEDMGEGDLYKSGADFVRNNVDSLGIRSVIFAPLMGQHGALGVMALFREEVRRFEPNQVELVESFAAQAAIAIENVRQFKALETLNAELEDRVDKQVGEIERMGKLKRFLPAAVADTVVSQGSEKMLSSHRALLGVLFCDIRGFTAFCETAEPEETIEVLQTYHEEMGKLINEHGAGVDHRMGDGIMVLFNDPVPCDDPAGDAVRLGIAMRSHMVEIAGKWKKLGHRLGFGVGVSLGYATVGMVGYEGRSDYTASGTAVNLAARLCDRAEDGEILMSPRAYTAVEDDFEGEPTGEIKLKGIREPVEVYRLLNESPAKT